MSKLNQWLTLIANFGVIAGIVFLALEIRINTEAIKAESHQAMFAGGQQELYTSMEYPDVILVMADPNVEPTFEQMVQLDAFLAAALGARQYAWRQYQSGVIGEDTWASEMTIISILVGSERNKAWWKTAGHLQFQGEFRELVTAIADGPIDPYWAELEKWNVQSDGGT